VRACRHDDIGRSKGLGDGGSACMVGELRYAQGRAGEFEYCCPAAFFVHLCFRLSQMGLAGADLGLSRCGLAGKHGPAERSRHSHRRRPRALPAFSPVVAASPRRAYSPSPTPPTGNESVRWWYAKTKPHRGRCAAPHRQGRARPARDQSTMALHMVVAQRRVATGRSSVKLIAVSALMVTPSETPEWADCS
jgi:hypothetical protein